MRADFQDTSIVYTDRLDDIGAAPSIGTVGDSYDGMANAMAETTIGLFKTELHRNPAALRRTGGPWRGLDDLELAVCEWVSWFNTEGLHSELGDRTPKKSKTTIVTNLSSKRPEETNPRSPRQTEAPGRLATA